MADPKTGHGQEPGAFGNSNPPKINTVNYTAAGFDYVFDDLPEGSRVTITLDVPGRPPETQTLSIPPQKVGNQIQVVLSGFIVNGGIP